MSIPPPRPPGENQQYPSLSEDTAREKRQKKEEESAPPASPSSSHIEFSEKQALEQIHADIRRQEVEGLMKDTPGISSTSAQSSTTVSAHKRRAPPSPPKEDTSSAPLAAATPSQWPTQPPPSSSLAPSAKQSSPPVVSTPLPPIASSQKGLLPTPKIPPLISGMQYPQLSPYQPDLASPSSYGSPQRYPLGLLPTPVPFTPSNLTYSSPFSLVPSIVSANPSMPSTSSSSSASSVTSILLNPLNAAEESTDNPTGSGWRRLFGADRARLSDTTGQARDLRSIDTGQALTQHLASKTEIFKNVCDVYKTSEKVKDTHVRHNTSLKALHYFYPSGIDPQAPLGAGMEAAHISIFPRINIRLKSGGYREFDDESMYRLLNAVDLAPSVLNRIDDEIELQGREKAYKLLDDVVHGKKSSQEAAAALEQHVVTVMEQISKGTFQSKNWSNYQQQQEAVKLAEGWLKAKRGESVFGR